MKNTFLIPLAIAVSTITCNTTMKAENKITWQHLGNTTNDKGDVQYLHRFTVTADTVFEGMGFCMFKRPTTPVNPDDNLVEVIPGYYYITSERFKNINPGDTVNIDLLTRSWFHNKSFFPDGMHLVSNGKPIAAQTERLSTVQFPEQWRNPVNGADRMIYGEEAFVINDSLRSQWRPGPYGTIPTPKSIELGQAMINVPQITIVSVDDPRHDYWKADIKAGGIVLATNSDNPDAIKLAFLNRINRTKNAEGLIPEAVIEDWSDYGYRGLMLDVSRNFLPIEQISEFLVAMNRYGLNTLHFHLGDDEAWRLEIPSIPELTEVGSHRGFTLTDDVPFLKGIYSGDGNPYNPDTPANGYYTVEQFVDFLKKADELGITVIPEFDSPGHSRAAIKSMDYRINHHGDDTYRLTQPGDTSKYSSAQAFYDNVMNPALEGPYRFWDTVMDDIIAIYKKAGVPLTAIHVGGDEVPARAWSGSEVAQAFMKEKEMESERELFAYFFERLAELAAEKGIKLSGWQEVALNHGEEYNSKVLPVMYSVNSWTNAGNKGIMMAQSGYPVVLSNVDYLYFDQTPTLHPEEPGLVWGGVVSEFSPLHATADKLCAVDSIARKNIKGVSAHLFAETIRDKAMAERYVYPRILGLAERAHNAQPTLTDNEYFGVITAEMPVWEQEGKDFYLRQPGIKVVEDEIVMNEPYGFGTIRYTVDGSDPNENSAVYESPVKTNGVKEIRARLFYGPAKSVTSILYLE